MKSHRNICSRVLGIALTCLLLMALLPVGTLAANSEVVQSAIDKGWIDSAETVTANAEITRAEFATVLYRALGSPQDSTTLTFLDISMGTPYATAVSVLASRGIVSGISSTEFAPDNAITREMCVTMLARAFNLTEGIDISEEFEDSSAISTWAQSAASAMARKGYFTGTTENRCEPQNTMTWDEAVSMLLDVYEGENQTLRFDYTEEIAEANFKTTSYTVPEAANCGLNLTSATGATGVVLVSASDKTNTTDLFINAYVASDELTVSGADIVSATKIYGDIETPLTVSDGQFSFTPETITVENQIDEIIQVTLTDGTIYQIHTIPEKIPTFEITANNNPTSGIYAIAIDGFMLQINTDGEITYYRSMGHKGKNVVANFQPHDLTEGRYYTYFYETNTDLRDPDNGYNSGMFVLMDQNYKEIEYITLQPTETHGEGYLDQHEIYVFSPTHFMLLSYSREFVSNIPNTAAEVTSAYVQAGIIQEVKDGVVVLEIDSTDYPELYELAMTGNDYASSSVSNYSDYVHPNSIDVDEKDDNIIVSLRSLSSVVKFDRETGEIIWILGGKGNQFSGLDELINSNGILFLYQHCAQYVDESITGNLTTISLFDNETNFGSNLTRTLMIELDENGKTGEVTNVINGADYDEETGTYHWGTHCGSVEYISSTSAVIGWGLHVKIDTNAETLGTKSVLSEVNPQTGELLFDLVPNRNPSNATSKSSFMSYRAYKTAD